MNDTDGQNSRRKPRKDPSEIGEIRVFSNPDPTPRTDFDACCPCWSGTQPGTGLLRQALTLTSTPSKGETTVPEKGSSSQGVPEADD